MYFDKGRGLGYLTFPFHIAVKFSTSWKEDDIFVITNLYICTSYVCASAFFLICNASAQLLCGSVSYVVMLLFTPATY